MSTDNGYPFFFYSSIVDDNFYLTDLETIINTQSFNHMKPFVYDQENVNKNDIESQATTHNTLRIGSFREYFKPSTRRWEWGLSTNLLMQLRE